MRLIESQKEVIDTLLHPAKYSSAERKRAYLFSFVYILGIIAFACSMLHFVSGWVAALVVQLVQLIFALMYAFNINDYSEHSVSAMECERSCNPLIDGYVALRVLQVMQGLFMRSYIAVIMYTICLAYILWRLKRRSVYIDATNLWREVSKFEKESYLLILTDVVMLVVVLLSMIFSIIFRYAD